MRMLKLIEADINYEKNYILMKISICNVHYKSFVAQNFMSTGKCQ